MHIAAAITTNLISIHTWTDPRRVGPYNASAWIWRSGDLRQMRDFPAGTKLAKGRSFRRGDVAGVTQLVADLWEANAV
jgi:ADP-heptose:LPS heptosyltransferase